MAKAPSPVRLEQDLMLAATQVGERFHRSTAEQVEYWASIGRRVADILDPNVLLSVAAGLARVRIEPVVGEPADPDAVFRALESDRQRGTLPSAVSSSPIRYQASRQHPGYLEQIASDGTITVGLFKHGVFVPLNA